MRLWQRRSTPMSGSAVSALEEVSATPALTAVMADVALNDPNEDRLSRAGFAERLAQTMTQRSQAGSVVGLYADWGEGKSTVLSFVEHYLAHQTRPVVVIRFNPWFDSDESAIIKQFFAAVATALGVDLRTRREKAGDWIRKANPFLKTVEPSLGPSDGLSKHLARAAGLNDLAKAVDFKVGPVNLSGLMEAVGNALGEPTLRSLRDRLLELLTAEASGRDRRVVVLIDDIDRLEASQVATVFRMIKLAADFPMLSVLTAFAPLPVAQALGARFGGGGDPTIQGTAFLEKIVQVPVRLPPADPNLVAALMQDLLGQVISAHCGQLPAGEQARMEIAMDRCVWPLVTTLRMGKQLLNKADFALPVMRGEVNPCDQVILQALELLHPDLYRFIATNKALLVKKPGPSEFRAARIGEIDQAVEGLPSASRGPAKDLLQLLFPHLQSLYGNTWYEPHHEEEWARGKRVCSPSYFSRFFAFALPVGDILDSEIEAVINAAWPANRAPLAALLASQEPNLVLQKLTVHSTGLSAARSLDVARAVAAAGAGLPTLGGRPFEPAFSAGMLISRLLYQLPSDERQAAAVEALDFAEPGLAAITMLAIEASGADNPDTTQHLLGEAELRAVSGVHREVAGHGPGVRRRRGAHAGCGRMASVK
ncbi:P-loop NTPase fold protein, partial [Kitasatospora sp. MAP5-34]|uniref:KAP family P-loop NTPase fold protein n=1 Tax=Kitasatospora sp. MAP5-34 TaxID=3035102 RepID=UPI002476BBC0